MFLLSARFFRKYRNKVCLCGSSSELMHFSDREEKEEYRRRSSPGKSHHEGIFNENYCIL